MQIQKEIKEVDYSSIGVACYICNQVGHISLECAKVTKILGNRRVRGLEKETDS